MAMTSISGGASHRWSLPNLLTYGRIVAVPLVIACMFWPRVDAMRWIAFALFAAAAVTDFFDGYLARAWSQQSALGRMLDPIADKLLVAAMLFMLVADQTIAHASIVAAIVILCREILVSGLALGFLIVGPAGDKVLPHNTQLGLAMLWVAAILTLYTGWDYLNAGVRHILAMED
jgi:CDP-diacylglycerol--glycerol-3-phosphate 3-phosphatidyltransferase/cardiolipin synthase